MEDERIGGSYLEQVVEQCLPILHLLDDSAVAY